MEYIDFLKREGLVIEKILDARIYIDPGHGGDDPGAVSGDFVERDINLVMALSLAGFLKFLGADIKLSRKNNLVSKNITMRCNEAIKWKADLIISVHNNAGNGDGFEIIHTIFTENSIGDEVAKSIADAVIKYTDQNFRRYIQEKNSRDEDYFGINRLSGSIPSLITEFAFLDNVEDRKIIDSIPEQENAGVVLGVGIAKYYGVLKDVEIKKTTSISSDIEQIINSLIRLKDKLD